MARLVPARLGDFAANGIRVGARILAKGTTPIVTFAVDPATTLGGIGLLEHIAPID